MALLAAAALICSVAVAQQADSQSIVYLKNGSVVHGDVIEVTPQSARVVNGFGDVMIFDMADVERITRNPSQASAEPQAQNRREVDDLIGCPARGYRGFLDLNRLDGYLYGTDDCDCYYSRAGLLTTHGFQFNPKIFVGAGLGVLWQADSDQESDFYCIVPIYSAFRCDFLERKVSPFVDFRLGGFANTSSCSDFNGLFLSLSVGVRVRRFNASLGYEHLNNLGDDTDYSYEDDHWVLYDRPSLCSHSFVLRLGVDFGRRM